VRAAGAVLVQGVEALAGVVRLKGGFRTPKATLDLGLRVRPGKRLSRLGVLVEGVLQPARPWSSGVPHLAGPPLWPKRGQGRFGPLLRTATPPGSLEIGTHLPGRPGNPLLNP